MIVYLKSHLSGALFYVGATLVMYSAKLLNLEREVKAMKELRGNSWKHDKR